MAVPVRSPELYRRDLARPPAPTPTVSPWPEITAAQIAARLYLDAPNRISDPAALDHSLC